MTAIPHTDSHPQLRSPRLYVAWPVVGIAYALLGALGLALAIPPGYASPIFPAAGFALAVALCFGVSVLPAIWLGSVSLNLGVALMNGNLSATSFWVALAIGTGAALQAWVGQYLVRRWSAVVWQRLEHEGDVFRFLALGGGLACVVSATCGVAVLVVAGVIPASAFGYAWWSWYVGDTLGVLTVTPLALALFMRHQREWHARLKATVLPACAMLALAVVAFLGAARWENVSQKDQLDDQGNILAQALAQRFIAHREALAALARVIEISPDLGIGQFDHFTRSTLREQSDVFALSFNPEVMLARRADFERQMAPVYPDQKFQITERDAERRLVPAASREKYVAVGYISPLEGNRPAIGFDINSEPTRRDAITRARMSGRSDATAPIRLVQEKREGVGVLILTPAFRQHSAAGKLAAERELLGFAVVVIKVETMVDIAVKAQLAPGLVLELDDMAMAAPQRVLYRSDRHAKAGAGAMVWQKRIMMADREWTLRLFPTDAYLQQHRPWLAWGVGVVGLMFAAVLQVLLLGVTGRTSLIQRQVDEQTVEIRTKNVALTQSEESYRLVNESLREAMQKAEVANLAKSQFLATMSHEIRTPMNGILGMAQLLMTPDLKDAERQDYVRTILSSGQTLMSLLNDILDLSKIEAGKYQLDAVVFEPPSLLQELKTLFSGAVQVKQLRLDWQWDGPSQPRYLADAHRVRQMVANLLGNAIKFTQQGSIRIDAHEVERDHDSVVLEFSVTDTGIGVAPDKLDLLFKPFSQTDSSITREFGGSGLGLSIVSHLARAMGGEVGVQSERGKGSRFWFRIRADVVSADNESSQTVPVAPPAVSSEASSARLTGHVLVAEDNPVNAMVIGSMLGTLGITMTLLQDGQQAVNAILQGTADEAGRQPALILMDLHMPVMDGYTATQRIREWEAAHHQPHLPIIALTADAFAEDRQHCLAVGMDDFLTKPIALDALKAALVKWLAPAHAEPR